MKSVQIHIQFLFTTHDFSRILLNQNIPKKPLNDTFEDMELTAGGSYSMWNFLEWIRKQWNIQGWSTKKPHSLGVPFLIIGSSRGVTHFYGITLNTTFDFSRISKTDLFAKVFPQPLWLFFFWNRSLIDR